MPGWPHCLYSRVRGGSVTLLLACPHWVNDIKNDQKRFGNKNSQKTLPAGQCGSQSHFAMGPG
jgi:hypothetical protein